MTRLTDLQDPYRQTKNATAVAADIATGKTAYGPDGELTGDAYTPAMMEFDGSTGYYDKSSVSVTGNKITVLWSFAVEPFTGDTNVIPLSVSGVGGVRVNFNIFSSDNSDPDKPNKMQVYVQSSVGAYLAILVTPLGFVDGNRHTCLFAFDGDLGEATFIIDGQNADDTANADRSAPTTGTLTTSSVSVWLGSGLSGSSKTTGDIGFFGYADAYLTNWSDFMDANGNPKALDESGWTQWGSQPLFWNPHGYMEDNRGSAGNMTKNGTIIVGDGGNR